jgi:hypothetical protein
VGPHANGMQWTTAVTQGPLVVMANSLAGAAPLATWGVALPHGRGLHDLGPAAANAHDCGRAAAGQQF